MSVGGPDSGRDQDRGEYGVPPTGLPGRLDGRPVRGRRKGSMAKPREWEIRIARRGDVPGREGHPAAPPTTGALVRSYEGSGQRAAVDPRDRVLLVDDWIEPRTRATRAAHRNLAVRPTPWPYRQGPTLWVSGQDSLPDGRSAGGPMPCVRRIRIRLGCPCLACEPGRAGSGTGSVAAGGTQRTDRTEAGRR